ncbi:right-handed parallel beta-helix repeat-containing protein [Elizabethkingia ursingii]|uniref:right-handed parallel beta-helix repeat-containing protein n=1 Tax=Elizabethkingia ursingii TaxID=1756150 RepID=UPI0020123756|nr:right-handed parallel beta-helix repeat-containing protein [Elizabethkingia ursingii]MCL1671844.1 right-handed parallel beta-helix repeat-containing protein [Elizabethkingia ursingii]
MDWTLRYKKDLLIIITVFSGLFWQFSCSGQGFNYKNYKKELFFVMPFESTENKSLVKIEDYLPKDYIKDASKDYTSIVQDVIIRNRKVVFPDFPLFININGLTIPSDTEIYFSKNSKLIQEGVSKERTDLQNIREWYDIIRIYNKENIKIFNAKIVGNRYTNKGKKGEWGAGIGIRNSKNILIQNCIIENTWGDGIFVGSEDGGKSSDIYLKNIQIDYSRRTGIAVTSGENIHLNNIFISNIHGTAPHVGLDLEPSWNKDQLNNIYIKNVKTFNCANYGFTISLDQLSVEAFKSKNVNIYVDGYTDRSSNYSFGYFINSPNSKYDPVGNINLKNIFLDNAREKAVKNSKNRKSIKIYSYNVRTRDNKNTEKDISIK